MKHTINCNWIDAMNFEASIGKHKIQLDAVPPDSPEGKGTSPKPLMLVALAGCTSMDIVSLLKKMRQEASWYNIKIEAELMEEHPKHYETVKITYEFKESDGLDKSKVEKAVSLSLEKYCGVAFMFSKFANIHHVISYL